LTVASTLFDTAADLLEQRTSLDRLEARGTLRLALKEAGLDIATLSVEQLGVVFEKILPGELERRGVDDASTACDAVMKEVALSPAAAASVKSEDAESVFKRLGRD
jgi:hypothetical protein